MKLGISLTERCYRMCWFCYAMSHPTYPTEMDFDELSNFILELRRLKHPPLLCFGGGEPFEYRKIIDLINLLERLRYPYSITSNLMKIPCNLGEIMRYGWLWGSIHYPSETQSVINILKSTGKKNVGVNIMVMRDYLPVIYDVVEEVIKAGLRYIITFFKAVGRGVINKKQELTFEEKKELIVNLCRRYGGVYTDSCQGLSGDKKCTCGVSWFTITVDKVLKPNSFYPSGVKLERLTLAEFLKAKDKIPKQVHLQEVK